MIDEALSPATLRWLTQRDKAEMVVSDDVCALHWLSQHRAGQDFGLITALGQRWLTRAIWHLEERVEGELRGKP